LFDKYGNDIPDAELDPRDRAIKSLSEQLSEIKKEKESEFVKNSLSSAKAEINSALSEAEHPILKAFDSNPDIAGSIADKVLEMLKTEYSRNKEKYDSGEAELPGYKDVLDLMEEEAEGEWNKTLAILQKVDKLKSHFSPLAKPQKSAKTITNEANTSPTSQSPRAEWTDQQRHEWALQQLIELNKDE
jgi:hypothetical protein